MSQRDIGKRVRSADLRNHTITIEAPANTLAATETEVATRVPAAISVTPLQFQRAEGLTVGGLSTQTEYTVSVRYREDIEPSYVLVEECHTRRRFQIIAVVPTDRGDALDIRCVVA